jgi:hypothetical protein
VKADDFDDEQLAQLSRDAACLRPGERDALRERVALMRSMLEITGCRTVREAVEQLRIWKGKVHGHPDITAN